MNITCQKSFDGPQMPEPTIKHNKMFIINEKLNNGWVDGIDRCAQCPNDPRNGGTGVCFCTIPHMYGPNRITCCYSQTTSTIVYS